MTPQTDSKVNSSIRIDRFNIRPNTSSNILSETSGVVASRLTVRVWKRAPLFTLRTYEQRYVGAVHAGLVKTNR